MRFRFFIYCAATLAFTAIGWSWEQVGTEYRTYLYMYTNSLVIQQDSSSSDTIFRYREVFPDSIVSVTQYKVYEYILPQNWQTDFNGFELRCNLRNLQGDSPIAVLQLYPQENGSNFYFHWPNTWWLQFGLLPDSILGNEYLYITPPATTEHNQELLEADFPNCQRIYIGVLNSFDQIDVAENLSIFWREINTIDPLENRFVSSIQLYPTFFTDAINYQGPEGRYKLYNLLGQRVREGLATSIMDFSALPTGVYFFRLEALHTAPLMTRMVKIK